MIRLLALGAALVVVAGAGAAASVRPPSGALTQLRGSNGCVMQIPRPAALVDRCGGARAVGFASEVAVSDDGRNVYVGGGHSIAVFHRDRSSGALRQLAGRAGCVEYLPRCSAGALNGLSGLVVAPGGRHVYASSFWFSDFHGSLGAFARDRRTGALTALRCNTCREAGSVDYSTGLAISGDGTSIYTASPTLTPVVGVLARDVTTGLLSEVPGPTGCVRRRKVGGCAAAAALPFEPVRVAVSPDSRNVYVASGWTVGATTVFAFARDLRTGGVTPLPEPSGCVKPDAAASCTAAAGLAGLAREITVAPDGRSVYVLTNAGEDAPMLTIFTRDPDTGVLSQDRGPAACLTGPAGSSECSAVAVLDGRPDAGDVVVSPRGESVYVSGERFRDEVPVIATFRRDLPGGLVPLRRPYGCVSPARDPRCTRATALEVEAALALSPDGRNLYATRYGSVAVFRRHP
jgi:DNA-binding beta-propeller fold protein YncE